MFFNLKKTCALDLMTLLFWHGLLDYSIIVTSPPTKQHHDEYRKQSRNELNISDHQTETVISNPHDFQTEKMSTDLNSMLTKQHASNGLKNDIPTLTHKQLINAYIEKKADNPVQKQNKKMRF